MCLCRHRASPESPWSLVTASHRVCSEVWTSEQFAVTTWRALDSDPWYITDTHYKYQTRNENQKGWETQLSVRTTNKSWIVTIQNISDRVITFKTLRDMQVTCGSGTRLVNHLAIFQSFPCIQIMILTESRVWQRGQSLWWPTTWQLPTSGWSFQSFS